MAWRDDLVELRKELADVRAERLQQAAVNEAEHQRQLERLSQLASTLDVTQMLAELNVVLLDGKGEVESFTPSDAVDGDELDDDEELALDDDEMDEDADVFTDILSWEEGGEREIAVDLGLTEDGFYLRVNGADIRTERRALEQALIRAFRDELGI